MRYRKVNLKKEDTFNDFDCADYEVEDYFESPPGCDELLDEIDYADEEELEAEDKPSQNMKTKGRKRKDKNIADQEELNLYTRNITVERGEKSRQRYARLAEMARTGTVEQKKAAKEEACLYMKGIVRDYIARKYRTYTERDSTYAEDLEQDAYLNIAKYLERYDPEKGLPSTFFFPHIKSAMATLTNRMKNQISSSDVALIRKIKNIDEDYERLGRKPTVADYAIETSKSISSIKDILKRMSLDINTHLEAFEDYDQLFAGDPSENSIFDSPENIAIRKIMVEGIMKRMNEKFTEDEISIFLRCEVYLEPIPAVAKSLQGRGSDDRVRRTIEKIRNSICYDPEIRKMCASYIREDPVDLAVISILQIDGAKQNMDLLETCIL